MSLLPIDNRSDYVCEFLGCVVKSRVRVLMPLKYNHVEGLMHVKSFEAQSPLVGPVVLRGGCLLRCHPHHMIKIQNYEFITSSYLVNLNLDQRMRATSDLAPSPFPSFHTTPRGGL
ncbi:hypothetical protein TNCV_207941 [Trichonephila clavipes]|nr:hypothetical protein TNCV_207941 [Trichonephila clavipes]